MTSRLRLAVVMLAVGCGAWLAKAQLAAVSVRDNLPADQVRNLMQSAYRCGKLRMASEISKTLGQLKSASLADGYAKDWKCEDIEKEFPK